MDFFAYSWTLADSVEDKVDEIAKSNPDYIFLPDDFLVQKFGDILKQIRLRFSYKTSS